MLFHSLNNDEAMSKYTYRFGHSRLPLTYLMDNNPCSTIIPKIILTKHADVTLTRLVRAIYFIGMYFVPVSIDHSVFDTRTNTTAARFIIDLLQNCFPKMEFDIYYTLSL